METIIDLDQSLFFVLNGMHQPWLDQLMFWISDKIIWIPFYLFLAGAIIYKYKWRGAIYLLAIGVTIGITDQIISGFMKGYFERFRPSRDPIIGDLVHTVNNYKGGKYGFASSHSGNAFALAMFIYLLFREYKWIGLIFLWAAIVAYSRVYLGVHYPGDILAGGLIGLSLARLIYNIAQKTLTKYPTR